MFTTFSPAPSPKALKEIRRKIKYEWRLQSKIHLSLQEIAKEVNPIIQGWINYYCKFNNSSFVPIIKYINDRLRIWAQRKFANLRKKKCRAIDLIKRIIKAKPTLFAHWKWIPMY